MRISDWSSDVCSSDLRRTRASDRAIRAAVRLRRRARLRAPAPLAARAPRVRADDRRLAGARRGEPAREADGDAGHGRLRRDHAADRAAPVDGRDRHRLHSSEVHTSERQSLMRISYAVFRLNKKKITTIEYVN